MCDAKLSPDELRRRAEATLRARTAEAEHLTDPRDVAHLLHELGVHQVELELQNEQLRQTQAELELQNEQLRHTQAELAAANDRFRDLFERAPVGYLVIGLDGVVRLANARATALLAVPLRQLLNRQLAQWVAPESWPAFQTNLQRVLRGGGSCWVEVALQNGVQGRRWVGIQLMLLYDAAHSGPQCRLALLDIDERVRQRQHLARLAAIVDSSSEAVIGTDPVGRVVSWNSAAERLFGWDEQQMLGRTLDALVPPERRSEHNDLLRRVRRGDSVTAFETERRHRDGTRLQVSISTSPLFDEFGQLAGSSVMAVDVGVRKQAEELLHTRLRQLDLLSHAGHALIMSGTSAPAMQAELFESVRLAVGADVCLAYQVRASEAGLTLWLVQGAPEGHRLARPAVALHDSPCGLVAQRGAALVLEDLQASDLPQAQTLKASGACSYAGFPLVVGGRVDGVLAFVSLQHKRLREGDLQVMQTVSDQVSTTLERHRLIEQLREREGRLERADRTKDEFIATLAHELRNPLAPIRNAVQIMRLQPSPDPRLSWCRDVIDRQVAQMARLLDDLLDVGRIARNRIELRREPMDLRTAVEQAVETVRPAIAEHGHRLSVVLPEQPVVVYGDASRLTQVFGNLLGNAAKYTEPGGHVGIELRTLDDQAEVVVHDDGIGISADQLPRIFDMFVQLAPALERSGGGLGIGLALARELIQLHGGDILAASPGPARGSTFTVSLPMAHSAPGGADGEQPAATPAAASLPAPPAPPASAAARRILVVDDNADAADSLGMLLSLAGHQVQVVYGGRDALQTAARWQPDIAFVDIGLPDLNGYELSRLIRAEPWGKRIRLVACTGWGQTEDRRRARAAGFDYHLVKPIDATALTALVSSSRAG